MRFHLFRLLAVSCAALSLASLRAQDNLDAALEKRVDQLVSRMTLAEKIGQMQNHAPAIARLGVPEYDWWNEGLHGIARSGYATVFPQAIGLAASWDTRLLHEVAGTISTEARAKYHRAIREGIHSIYYGLTIWSPNINIFRDPRWGRGQETYGEDPYLTSRLGVAFVTGLQGDDAHYLRTVATPKHFAVHSGPESERHRFDVKPSAFDLEDTYLPAFRATITEGHADSIMCAYNAVDGVPACANKALLNDKLRSDWHFQGYVTSDCGAISDFFAPGAHGYAPDKEHAAAAALKAGTDTSCGTEYAALAGAVKQGLVSEAEIDTAVKRLFKARFRLGMFDPAARVPYADSAFKENDSESHRALALKAAREAMVLLANDRHTLPLGSGIKTLAVIGPDAASLAALEGNYNGVPSHPVLPVDGLEKEFAGRARVVYAQGAPYVNGAPLPVPRTALSPRAGSHAEGLQGEYFDNADFRGKPMLNRVDQQIDFDWNSAAPAPGLQAGNFAVRWTGTITAPKIGDYRFGVKFAHCYPCYSSEAFKMYLDGKQVAAFATDESKSYHASGAPSFPIQFRDTLPHTLRIEYAHRSQLFGAGFTFNWQVPPGSLLPEAVAACRQADAVVAFVGLSPELEGEEMPVHVPGFAGGDRTSIELPDAQGELVRTAAALGKPVILVLMNGSALALTDVRQHAAAVLEAWYPGESGGEAIAETLSGRNNPAGRLPVTFPQVDGQLPPFDDYSMKERTYRFFHGQPLFRFGDGLSYTQFDYSDLHLPKSQVQAGESLVVEANVRNSGARAGDEVAELYVTTPGVPQGELRALRSFERFSLKAGETRHLRFTLDPRALSEVDAKGKRSVVSGQYRLSLGGSQPSDRTLDAVFSVTGNFALPE